MQTEFDTDRAAVKAHAKGQALLYVPEHGGKPWRYAFVTYVAPTDANPTSRAPGETAMDDHEYPCQRHASTSVAAALWAIRIPM